MNSKQLIDILEEQWDILKASKDPSMEAAMILLHGKLEHPQCYISMVGETSSGKSTLINSFLGKKFLVSSSRPTTGTVTWIEYGLAQKDELYAIYRDASVKTINEKEFQSLTLKPEKDLLRLRANLYGTKDDYRGLTVFDTPGFNSIVTDHEEILREFLPESDFIVFTVSYRVGFGLNDQDLMTFISDLDKRFDEIPVLLVVNRTPTGINSKDKRIVEIRSHAEDSLHRPVELMLVDSSLPDESGNSTLPDAAQLWKTIRDRAFAPKRLQELTHKASFILDGFLLQRQQEIEGALLAADNSDAIEEFKKILQENDEQAAQARGIVESYMSQFEWQIPRLLEKEVEKLKDSIDDEISESVKWTEKDACTAYISSHAIPFGIRSIAKTLEDYIEQQFELMDKEINEQANKTIEKINNQAELSEKAELSKLFINLGQRLGMQLAKETASSALINMGGCCGMAAGAGNLAKTVVKHAGKLVGKTFSREVYKTIGKVFTKKMLERLNVVLSVALETIDYIHEAATWQNKLKEEANKTIDAWHTETKSDLIETMIPNFRTQNLETVNQCFDAMKADINQTIIDMEAQANSETLNNLRINLDSLKQARLKLKD